MLKKLFWAVCVTAMAFWQTPQAFGQSPGELGPPDTPPKLSKWELAIDALPLLDKQSDAFGFLLRKYVGDSARKAIRFKLNPLYGNGLNTSNQREDYTIGVGLGLDWLKRYGRTAIYYGFEGDFSFRRYRLFISDSGGNVLGSYPASERRWAANVFVGGRYQIHQRWAVSVESFLRYQYIFGDGRLPSGFKASYFDKSLRIIPIRVLYLSYRL
jgi:hypothetical protein